MTKEEEVFYAMKYGKLCRVVLASSVPGIQEPGPCEVCDGDSTVEAYFGSSNIWTAKLVYFCQGCFYARD